MILSVLGDVVTRPPHDIVRNEGQYPFRMLALSFSGLALNRLPHSAVML
jgi:hypothetical protein